MVGRGARPTEQTNRRCRSPQQLLAGPPKGVFDPPKGGPPCKKSSHLLRAWRAPSPRRVMIVVITKNLNRCVCVCVCVCVTRVLSQSLCWPPVARTPMEHVNERQTNHLTMWNACKRNMPVLLRWEQCWHNLSKLRRCGSETTPPNPLRFPMRSVRR